MTDTGAIPVVPGVGTQPGITVIGAGSWGTALAIQLARAGSLVKLWGRDKALLEVLGTQRENPEYLPGASFPETLRAEPDWQAALDGADHVLVSVPSHAFRSVLEALASTLENRSDFSLCWATKGMELSTGLLPSQVVNAVVPKLTRTAVLSGPTFAHEVGRDLPTAMTVASADAEYAASLSAQLTSPHFRAYTSTDIIGVEVGGAVKNVLAIAAGLSDGLGFGANARVALINRGLREMMRFGVALGAQEETFMGLAGMGDLVLTCTDDQSRNRRMGLALAEGLGIEQAQRKIRQVVEGVLAARVVHEQALALGVDMPIIEQVYRIVIEGADPRTAVAALMARAVGAESVVSPPS